MPVIGDLGTTGPATVELHCIALESFQEAQLTASMIATQVGSITAQ